MIVTTNTFCVLFANQIAGKRDPALEGEVLAWIEAILGEKLPAGSFEEVLRDGVILCKLISKLLPGSVPKINTSGGQFKFMENINHFQTACRRYGVPDVDVFQTVDLYEKRNIPAVTQCIMALGRTCYLHPEFKGPFLGPKVSFYLFFFVFLIAMFGHVFIVVVCFLPFNN